MESEAPVSRSSLASSCSSFDIPYGINSITAAVTLAAASAPPVPCRGPPPARQPQHKTLKAPPPLVGRVATPCRLRGSEVIIPHIDISSARERMQVENKDEEDEEECSG